MDARRQAPREGRRGRHRVGPCTDDNPTGSDDHRAAEAADRPADGQVFQFDGNTGADKLLLAVTPDTIGAGTSYEKTYWSDNVFIQLPDAAIGNGIDKDDVVDVWGDAAGQYSYEAALGTRSVPSINARYFELVSKG